MVTATLSKVGNSMGVLLPKAIRSQARFDVGEALRLESPRPGVVVITAMLDDSDRLARFAQTEARIAARADRIRDWPVGMDADALIRAGKDARAHELAPL